MRALFCSTAYLEKQNILDYWVAVKEFSFKYHNMGIQ